MCVCVCVGVGVYVCVCISRRSGQSSLFPQELFSCLGGIYRPLTYCTMNSAVHLGPLLNIFNTGRLDTIYTTVSSLSCQSAVRFFTTVYIVANFLYFMKTMILMVVLIVVIYSQQQQTFLARTIVVCRRRQWFKKITPLRYTPTSLLCVQNSILILFFGHWPLQEKNIQN